MIDDEIQQTDVTPRPMGEILRREYPFVESSVRLNNLFGSVIAVPDSKGGSSKKFEESRNICFTEPEYFDVFDSKWVSGNAKQALSAPNTVVLSRDYAKKYFGRENVMGEILRFDNKVNLTVTGIIENPPPNTQLRYDVLISYSTIPGFYGDTNMLNVWAEPSTMCWVTLKEGTEPSRLTSSFPEM
ncbi:hypothetical protein FHS68_000134 [Dyadobacter arcticus]|uniref:MacB-like periplasmic core domain-containing protein n=1 Tax=Dyadobacter arcticus TaxID=1078754 RepID=A0ABX0UD95_9BACT|nr:hypothetical protein [Dyadobacter arcticus]